MTGIDSWSPWAAIIFIGAPTLLAAAGLAFSLYLTHRHLGAIKEALKNSRYIYIWGDSLGKRGLIWSLLEMSKIAGMILMPKSYIRLGDLDPMDHESFPPYLKRRLKIVTAMIVTSLIWVVLVAMLLEFR
ncbi:hypothetical protein HX875_16785 [Pseudomonas yamanorum]|jgi:hypothetical protein|uniref:Uncharacterized protein n=1 Tax=Pseudomonas yamanorum TaxID=515393 RepID=A0A7Y8FFI6_9PSED|nr:hypothetical protein [Pseudomonas yamanorum]NWE41130.1 hypothetical protein [Pseudomonas yamanorum]NWE78078.1 hypothetical protein [Pseudomonas yamanorum]